jgi:MoaA/NifB/PqqE/SkfB family radical SAM enzyme
MNDDWGGVIISPRCENNCQFCNPNKKIDLFNLKQQEINTAKNLIDFKRQCIENIEISGSDPIEYDKITGLVKYIKNKGFKEIQLSTHGRRFHDKNFARNIIKAGLNRARIPIYGSNAMIHDSITNSTGSFNETIQGIKNLADLKIHVNVSCLIMQNNKEDLCKIVDLVKSLGITDFYFSVPCLSNSDDSYYIPLKDIPVYARKVFEHSKKIKFQVQFHEIPYCVIGKDDLCINTQTRPPELGKYCQPPEKFKSKIRNIPSYRLKKHLDFCKKCSCCTKCSGFFVNDIERFGSGSLGFV